MGLKPLRRAGILGVLILVVGLVSGVYQFISRSSTPPSKAPSSAAARPFPPIYALPPTPADRLRNPEAVTRSLSFLASMQPEGTYVLSTEGTPVAVPMDVAHAAIAFVSVDRIASAESAMTWLYRQIVRPENDGAIEGGIDYSGSWYDALGPDGQPVEASPRGRGEAVGMALIATYSIYDQDPSFLTRRVGDARIVDLVRLATEYLTRPTMQAEDGRFYHSPDYRVAFNEECARMALGLKLASRMLRAQGDLAAAERAAAASNRGLESLDTGKGMSQGMAYDFYARSIWGLATPDQARDESARLKEAGLLGPGGVKNWDWQLSTASSPLVWLRWWSQAQTTAPSQTFDYAIASVGAGDLRTALELEKLWVSLQRPDGGFDDGFLFGPFGVHLGFGQPTSYAAARFILLEHLLTTVAGTGSA